MKLSSEVKVGIIGILSIAVLIWGINYLKGRNILSSTYSLIAFYNNTGGLEASAPVLMNGVKIGYVGEIKLQPDKVPPIMTVLSIEKSYPIDESAIADLHSADLLGTRAIRILSTGNKRPLHNNDTIRTSVTPDMFSSFQEQLTPVINQVKNLTGSLDTLATKINILVTSENTKAVIQDISSVSEALRISLDTGGDLNQSIQNLESFTSMLSSQQNEVASLVSHLNSISESVDSAGIEELTYKIDRVATQFSSILEQINSGSGSAGRLLKSDTLSNRLETLISDLDILVKDLKENPQDYVQISLFGRTKKSQ